MGKPFNYFQYDYTGAGTGVAPFVQGQFSGFFLPANFELGKTDFNLPLISDLLLTPTALDARISANVEDSNVHVAPLGFSFYGKFFPLSNESGLLDVHFTGQFAKDNIDAATFYTPFTGQMLAVPRDDNILNIVLSGQQQACLTDTHNYNFIFSGTQEGCLTDRSILNFRLSGKFITFPKDAASTDFSILSGTFSRGNIKVIWSGDDVLSTNFYPTQIVWGIG